MVYTEGVEEGIIGKDWRISFALSFEVICPLEGHQGASFLFVTCGICEAYYSSMNKIIQIDLDAPATWVPKLPHKSIDRFFIIKY